MKSTLAIDEPLAIPLRRHKIDYFSYLDQRPLKTGMGAIISDNREAEISIQDRSNRTLPS